jgi:hypothetical protein
MKLLSAGRPQRTSKPASLLSLVITDHLVRYGHSLVQFDPVAERKLLWKIDLYIVPTVALLYLFCFIDRANIGQYSFSTEARPWPHHLLQETRKSLGSRKI